MERRSLFYLGLGSLMVKPISTLPISDRMERAAKRMEASVQAGQVRAASVAFRVGQERFQRSFGVGVTNNHSFLLGSISKPMVVAALMTLYAKGKIELESPVQRYLPEFQGNGREKVRLIHLLTHVSGLPDQLPNNAQLRKRHAPLSDFIKEAMGLPLAFEPGKQYEYSSMAILLASEIAQRISGQDILTFTNTEFFKPLKMTRTALGLGELQQDEIVPVQIERAAPEAGGGDPDAKDWDWNSPFWRKLGAPWGGVHSTASDVLTFIDSFAQPNGVPLPIEVAKLMIRSHNPSHLPPRGLGFGIGPTLLGTGLSLNAFGHTGSTGTLAWHDPEVDMSCVVLTSLPGQALRPHPRELVASTLISA